MSSVLLFYSAKQNLNPTGYQLKFFGLEPFWAEILLESSSQKDIVKFHYG